MFRFLTLIMLVVVILGIGCDEEQKMMKHLIPVEEPMPEPEPTTQEPEITFDPQPPKPEELPAGLDIRETDKLSYKQEDYLSQDAFGFGHSLIDIVGQIKNSDLVFDDANSAVQSDITKAFFKMSEDWIAKFCGASDITELYPQIDLIFINRQARTDFLNNFLGKLDGGYFVWSVDHGGLEVPENSKMMLSHESESWWIAKGSVYIIGDKAYYGLNLLLNFTHPNCK